MNYEKKYYHGFDVLRFLAVSFVAFFFHYRILLADCDFLYGKFHTNLLFDWGWLGVEFSFAISGFMAYNNYFDFRGGKESGWIRHFILKRMIRLYPMMMLTVIMATLGQWITYLRFQEYIIINVQSKNSFLAFILSMLCIQTGWFSPQLDTWSVNGPCWYLSVLMICYFIFALIIARFKDDKGKINMFFALMALLGAYCMTHSISFPMLNYDCGRGYLNFFIGILMAEVVELVQFNKQHKSRVILIALALIVLFAFTYRFNLWDSTVLTFCFVLSPCVILITALSRTVDKLTDNRLCRFLGDISYGIYLLNIPTAIWIQYIVAEWRINVDFNTPYFFVFHIVLSLVLAAMLHYLFEVPIGKKVYRAVQKIQIPYSEEYML